MLPSAPFWLACSAWNFSLPRVTLALLVTRARSNFVLAMGCVCWRGASRSLPIPPLLLQSVLCKDAESELVEVSLAQTYHGKAIPYMILLHGAGIDGDSMINTFQNTANTYQCASIPSCPNQWPCLVSSDHLPPIAVDGQPVCAPSWGCDRVRSLLCMHAVDRCSMLGSTASTPALTTGDLPPSAPVSCDCRDSRTRPSPSFERAKLRGNEENPPPFALTATSALLCAGMPSWLPTASTICTGMCPRLARLHGPTTSTTSR